MNTFQPERSKRSIPSSRASASVAVPPGSTVEPISEAQFAAIVRHYESARTDDGIVYTRADQPWEFKRVGPYVIVIHRTQPLPPRYYEVV
ncbi:MAG: hypothetical protein ACE5G0_22235 [Rhodothermales bacterium]